MAKRFMLSLSFCLLVLFQGSLARRQYQQQNECQLKRINAVEPDNRVECEAGIIESWDPSNHQQFRCAGVAVVRRLMQPNGLLLPSYSNSPQLIYIVRGTGMTGMLLPGCPETFQESQQSEGQGSSRFQDQHQKIRRFREGDILAIPAGVSHWCYNDGKEPVVTVSLFDISNSDNQLDNNPRNFYLAGNPEEVFQQTQEQRERQPPLYRRGQQSSCNNIFCGMDTRFIAEAFNVDEQVARRLQGENDNRGNIVKVKGGLQVVRPPTRLQEERAESEERDRERQRRANGIEETICTMRIKENIGDPSRADIFTPEAGRISTINSHNLPVLRSIQLSAERGVLYKDALVLPHWNLNAHSIMYVIRGRARCQVVDQNGDTVFDGEVREGQVLTVPQNFAVVKRAERERFEWISFKTNDNAMAAPLAGRTSAIRAMPVEVLANAFRISIEDARRIKFGQQETTLGSSKSQPGRAAA
ncbi:hypothetical protein K2173_018468 [Erythroxylum novogranatense]|uniref:Cupin type-1 domain-containing protein n=1 Tax=Erythroxylum novogranatense TaxID=1862640 RepID=A0AAV8UAJ5_9ROSI|nr:hypothetical protein K2173_018468 [Erythroxylum novogranatense]